MAQWTPLESKNCLAAWHLEGTDFDLIQEAPHPATDESRGFTINTMGCYRSSKLNATTVSDAMLEVEAIWQTGWFRPHHLHSLTSLMGYDSSCAKWIVVEDSMLPVKIGKKWHFAISNEKVVLGRQERINYSGCGRDCEDRLNDLKRLTEALPDYGFENRLDELVEALQTEGTTSNRHTALCTRCADAADLLAIRTPCECDDPKWQDKYGYPRNACENCDGLTPWRAYTESHAKHQPRPEKVSAA